MGPKRTLARSSDFLSSDRLDGSGKAELGFAFCETIMTDAFSQAPILIGSRAENQGKSPRNIDSIFLFLDFLLDVEGNDLPQEEIMTP